MEGGRVCEVYKVYSVHEVHVDAQQLEFLEAQLVAAGGRPVVLATHALTLSIGD